MVRRADCQVVIDTLVTCAARFPRQAWLLKPIAYHHVQANAMTFRKTLLSRVLSSSLAVALAMSAAFAGDDELRQQAKDLADGASKEMQTNHYVAAALAYAKALKLYEQAKDTDNMVAMQANIYWCKKKMNVDDIQAFLKAKETHGTGKTNEAVKAEVAEAKATLAKIDEVAERKVDVSEAKSYFDRAEKFEKSNQDKTLQIVIRYFEVANRFQNDPVGRKAQEICLKFQSKLNDELEKKSQDIKKQSDDLAALRNSYFTRKPPANGGETLPDKAAQDKALKDLKTIYKSEYASSKTEERRAFGTTLYKQQAKSKDEPVMRWAMLTEAIRLGIETEHYWVILRANDELATIFAGFDADAEKRRSLGRLGSRAGAVQVLKLLDDPKDPTANAVAGRLFCISGEWADGTAMLANGSDEAAKKAGAMDLLNPTKTGEQAELGDAWYDIAKACKNNVDRDAFLDRARLWYTKCQKAASGISKARIDSRLVEIDKLNPPDITDWNKITVNQWESLKAVTMQVEARKAQTDPGIMLAAGQKVRVVPHPTDTWQVGSGYYGTHTCTASGASIDKRERMWTGQFKYGELVAWLDKQPRKKCGDVLTGPGRLLLAPVTNDNIDSWWDSNTTGQGVIRVKIVRIDD